MMTAVSRSFWHGCGTDAGTRDRFQLTAPEAVCHQATALRLLATSRRWVHVCPVAGERRCVSLVPTSPHCVDVLSLGGVRSTRPIEPGGGVMRRSSLSILRPAVPVTRHRIAVAASLSAFTLLVMAGCSSAASTSGPATVSPSSPTGQTYASKAFVVPLTVTVDASLKSPPVLDSRNLLYWDAANSSANKVRFLVPTNLYRPTAPFRKLLPRTT